MLCCPVLTQWNESYPQVSHTQLTLNPFTSSEPPSRTASLANQCWNQPPGCEPVLEPPPLSIPSFPLFPPSLVSIFD
ncbi:hypothetical protein PCANC_27585 [Puccinia coronata f. sp. avenae]|uniref:Uncharacterized protein n=1 Tax=Puccinia coronata f. sp. avenae TaxID=200324 RepID=A0A2N5TLM6_9BASI|nr:hypothetical protein PCANC_27585 [Puccinia coronata f. sp. avenae]